MIRSQDGEKKGPAGGRVWARVEKLGTEVDSAGFGVDNV
jgi:hypothetical protein